MKISVVLTTAFLLHLLLSVLLMTGPVSVNASQERDTEPHPYIFTNQTLSATADVEAINQETREVVLRTPDGNKMVFIAGENVRNLDQVEPGDVVDYEYVSNMSLILVKQPGPVPESLGITVQSKAKPGEKPSTTTIDKRVRTATILALDEEANTFQLEWADGAVEEFTAENPENLKKASVGDSIVITKVEKMVISVGKPVAGSE